MAASSKLPVVPYPPSADPDDPELRSTWPHRAWTLAGSVAILSSSCTYYRLIAASGRPFTELLAVAMAAFAAYSLADLAMGVYHWLLDNYGNESTPLFGTQIAATPDHHRHPSTLALLDPCNKLHEFAVALPAADVTLTTGGAGAAAHAFVTAFAACVMLSVQFHAWAYQRPSRLPVGVEKSQHAGHHRPPYNINYCIVRGMWKRPLGRYNVFETLEKVSYRFTGVHPRSWAELNITELAEDGTAAICYLSQ